jgi:flavin reductase (DIM6/NTAB) family NADH-FMN oxidoreductase RutF
MKADIRTLFKIQCGLFTAGCELNGKVNACICNTLLEQSHIPVRLSVTLGKDHLTHDMVMEKRSVCVCALAESIPMDIIRRFGFVSGRKKDKFADITYKTDCNGNPYLDDENIIAARFSLSVYDTVDVGTHTLFLCTVDDMQDYTSKALTYSGYRDGMKK